jgi:uncharacterized protein
MTSFFPDVNVWLALSDVLHVHNLPAWNWLNSLPQNGTLLISRYTQLGLLRLLTNETVMGRQTLTVRQAWNVYDSWLEDARVEFISEPPTLDAGFRQATTPFSAKPACKWIGDCYLLAYAQQSRSTLVTFDRALMDLAHQQGCSALRPA